MGTNKVVDHIFVEDFKYELLWICDLLCFGVNDRSIILHVFNY